MTDGCLAGVRCVAGPIADWSAARRSGHLLVAAALLMTAGCHRGVHWTLGRFEDGYERARREKKLTFVYFRNWYLVECTDFEENVLKHPEVLAETAGMVCVPLSYDWDRPLAQRWELTAAPAIVVVSPTGRILTRQQGPMTREQLLKALRDAKAASAVGTQPDLVP